MIDKPAPETFANRLIRIGNEAHAEQATQYAQWEALARRFLGEESLPKDPK